MANRNRSLDPLIIDAARAEFLEYGFQKASVHKIAQRAGTTTGALYIRYQNKDELFLSLVRPAMEQIAAQMPPMEAMYRRAQQTRSADALLEAIRTEAQIYLELLYQHYEECILIYCKSGGSVLEQKMQEMMAAKSRQTVEFFRSIASSDIDFDGIGLIISEQFSFYRQILQRGYDKEKAVSCMKVVDIYLEAGWKAILEKIL